MSAVNTLLREPKGQPAIKTQQASENVLGVNKILDTDSYKLCHFAAYPPEVKGMFSYLTARTKGDTIVPFGLQMWIKKALLDPITAAEIDEAEAFAKAHGEPFNRADWDYLLDKYKGFLPITIRAVPEGMRVPSGVPLVTVECTDSRLFWLSSYIETSLQRGVWYPTTIATRDYTNWRILKMALDRSADSFDSLPFMLHCFGGRGVTVEEQAQAGGAHLVYFMGSDTISGIRAMNFYYGTANGMAAYSVPATEHSIQCAYGRTQEEQERYIRTVIERFGKPGAIFSVVLDGFDVYREVETVCALKDVIIATGSRFVVRPDSGDPLEVIPRILRLLDIAYGHTVNSKGYKVINNVGIIQGDGIDTEAMQRILDKVIALGFSAQNIVFGSGGGLLQKVNRDTYKFAQKASAILVNGEWLPISKDPVTDPGKASRAGRLTLLRSIVDNGFLVGDLDRKHNSEWVDVMETIYENGKLLKTYTLDEIRARAQE